MALVHTTAQKTRTQSHTRRRVSTRQDRYQKKALRDKKIGLIGLGYVGLPVAIAAAEEGFAVRGFDIDGEKVKQLQQGKAPFISKAESQTFRQHLDKMEFSIYADVLADVDVFFICVPTPVMENHTPDLSAVIEATYAIARSLQPGGLVIVESSINPGVCDEIILPILIKESGLAVEKDFFFAYCPERINPGDAKFNTRNIPRVIGASGPESMSAALEVYRAIIDAPFTPMGQLKEAEAVKMVENAFRDVNIAFVNELAMAFAREGIDIKNVIDGAATKPFAFMAHYPGCGVGGHCIPVDPYYLIQYGKQHGFTHNLLIQARETNNYMPYYALTLLRKALYDNSLSLRGSKIALLGLSYKKNVGDLRESPALKMQQELEREGAIVASFDPHAKVESTVSSLADALDGAAGVVIATDHDEFTALLPEDFTQAGVAVVIDGRNCLPLEEFRNSSLTYRGIGRSIERV